MPQLSTTDEKICSVCGADITHVPRIGHDHLGNIYCEYCWRQRQSEHPASAVAQTPQRHAGSSLLTTKSKANEMPLLPCAECGGYFDYTHLKNVNGKAMCMQCFAALQLSAGDEPGWQSTHASNPDAGVHKPADKKTDNAKKSRSYSLTKFILALIGGLVAICIWGLYLEGPQSASDNSPAPTLPNTPDVAAPAPSGALPSETPPQTVSAPAIAGTSSSAAYLERVDDDPVIQRVINRSLISRNEFRERKLAELDNKLQLMLLDGQMDLWECKYVEKFIRTN